MGGRQQSEKLNCVVATALTLILITHSIGLSDAKRNYGSNNRKTSGGSNSRTPSSNTHVTKPTYSNTGSNSHADAAKLSYPNYNSQPNRPATGGAAGGATGGNAQNPAPIGWNVPKQQGPPPAYSAANPAGGAHTNMHEPAPAYRPNNAAPPSYGASGSNVHQPITATNTQGLQSSYPGQQSHYPSAGQVPPGATYHSAGSIPAGATYYPSAGHAPGGYAPGGYAPGGYAPGGYGHMPAGGGYPSGGVPAGATYIPAGASLPAGATYYAQPPQQSSGLGFGSGLAAGAIGGALLGHVLTPTQTRVVEAAPSNNGGGGSGSEDRVIIINNGPPGSVTATGAGTSVINTGAPGAVAAPPAVGAGSVVDPNTPLAPMAPIAPIMNTTDGSVAVPPPVPMATMTNITDGGVAPPQPEQPAPGGIICVPVRLNETDPADTAKMIEVEKIACYPAPPPPPPGTPAVDANGQPMTPMNPAPVTDHASQQLQPNPSTGTPLAPMLAEQSSVRASGSSGAKALHSYLELMIPTAMMGILMAFGMH